MTEWCRPPCFAEKPSGRLAVLCRCTWCACKALLGTLGHTTNIKHPCSHPVVVSRWLCSTASLCPHPTRCPNQAAHCRLHRFAERQGGPLQRAFDTYFMFGVRCSAIHLLPAFRTLAVNRDAWFASDLWADASCLRSLYVHARYNCGWSDSSGTEQHLQQTCAGLISIRRESSVG